jgi:O-antigen/teichoic acid export membrane protein
VGLRPNLQYRSLQRLVTAGDNAAGIAGVIDKKFKSDVAFGYVTQGGMVAAGFLFMLIVTNYGGVAVYGALALVISCSNLLGNLVSLRTNEALVAFYKHGETTSDWGRCKFAILAGLLLDIGTGALLFALLFFNAEFIAVKILKSADAGAEVALYSYVIFAAALRSTPLAYLQATERIKFLNIITLAEQLMKLAAIVALVLTSEVLSFRAAVTAVLTSALITVIAAYMPLIFTLCGRFRSIRMPCDSLLVRSYARFTVHTFSSSALKAGNQNIDTLVLGYLTDTQTTGIYAVFRQFLSPLDFLSTPLPAIAYPRFVDAVIQRRYDDIGSAIRTVNRRLLTWSITIIMLSTVALAGFSLITQLELERTSFVAFAILALASVFRTQLWWGRAFANAVDPVISVKANVISTLLSLSLIYPMCSLLSMRGAAITVLVNVIAIVVFYKIILRRYESDAVLSVTDGAVNRSPYEKRIQDTK